MSTCAATAAPVRKNRLRESQAVFLIFGAEGLRSLIAYVYGINVPCSDGFMTLPRNNISTRRFNRVFYVNDLVEEAFLVPLAKAARAAFAIIHFLAVAQ